MEYWNKLLVIYSHLPAWFMAVLTFICSWLGDSKELMIYIFLSVVIDTLFGVIRAVKKGGGVKSDKLRPFTSKLLVYFSLMVIAVTLDKVLKIDSVIVTRGITAIIIVAEAWSTIASLAILFPKIQALAIVQKYLIAEISDKISVDKEEIEKTLNKE